jgi:dihydrofolate reductase
VAKESIRHLGYPAYFVLALMQNRRVDAFPLFINPPMVGIGMPVFKALDSKQDLILVKATSFDCGIVVLNYKPKDTTM